MISGLPPFYSTDRQVLFSNIREQELKFTRHHNTGTRDLLARLLVKDPAERLCSPEQIMRHDFFANTDW